MYLIKAVFPATDKQQNMCVMCMCSFVILHEICRWLHAPLHVCPVIVMCSHLLSLNTEDDVVQDFLWVDSCAKVADKVSTELYIHTASKCMNHNSNVFSFA